MFQEVLFFAQGLIDANDAGLPRPTADQPAVDKFIFEIYVAIGALGLLVLLVAGLRYITSQGDPAKITQAKNMIIYTLIGILIAALAATIVRYVMAA